MLRVYFNRREDFPCVWSIDNGDQSNEVISPTVYFKSAGRSTYTGQLRNPNYPVAWLEFFNVVFDQSPNKTVTLSS